MSEGEQPKVSVGEIVIRIVDERESEDRQELINAVNNLANVALRMTEVAERLEVVEEGDAAIVNTIHSFNERLNSLEKIVKLVEERLGVAHGTLANLTQDRLGEALEYLEGELDRRIKDAVAQAAFTATRSIGVPKSFEITTTSSTASFQLLRVAQDEAKEATPDEKESDEITLTPSEVDVQKSEEITPPDYTRMDKSLSVVNARVELILLFLLAQPGCRYESEDDNVYAEIKEALDLIGDSNWGNALASLRYKDITWVTKINSKRVREMGINKEDLERVLNEKFITQRVRDAFERADFSDEATRHTSLVERKKYQLDPYEKDIILALGEVEPALFVKSLEEQLAEKYGKSEKEYAAAIKMLLCQELIKVNKYNSGLKEYRLTPEGKSYFDAIITDEQERSEDPPFLAMTQAS